MATSAGGVVFWAIDNNNYYVAEIVPNGSYAFTENSPAPGSIWFPARRTNKSRATPTPLTKSGSCSSIISARCSSITSRYRNSAVSRRKVAEPWGCSPESETTVSDGWRFLDIVVMDNGKSKTGGAAAGAVGADDRRLSAGQHHRFSRHIRETRSRVEIR